MLTSLLNYLNKHLFAKVNKEAKKLNTTVKAKDPSGVIKIAPGKLKVFVQLLTTTPSIPKSTVKISTSTKSTSAALTTGKPTQSTSATTTVNSTARSAKTTIARQPTKGKGNRKKIFFTLLTYSEESNAIDKKYVLHGPTS